MDPKHWSNIYLLSLNLSMSVKSLPVKSLSWLLDNYQVQIFDWLIDSLIDWLIRCLNDWLIEMLINWLYILQLIDWFRLKSLRSCTWPLNCLLHLYSRMNSTRILFLRSVLYFMGVYFLGKNIPTHPLCKSFPPPRN